MEFDKENADIDDRMKAAEDNVKKNVAIDDNDLKRSQKSEKTREKRPFRPKRWPWCISAICFLIGYLCNVISYVTPYWLTIEDPKGDDTMNIGIWSVCSSISNCSYRSDVSDCVASVRVFGGVGVVGGLVVIILVLYVYIKQPVHRRCVELMSVIICFLSALAVQISTAIFSRTAGCRYADDLASSTAVMSWAWSLALAFASIFLLVGAGLMFLILELRQISKNSSRRPWNGRGMIIT